MSDLSQGDYESFVGLDPEDGQPSEPDDRVPPPCRHPKYKRLGVPLALGGGWECSMDLNGCGHRVSREKARAGRNARERGKSIERKEMRLAGKHTGNANKADDGQSSDGMFSFQAKSKVTSLFPGWMQLELDKLRTAHPGKVPVLVIIEAPGAGHKPRKLAVIEWSDWLGLHGKGRLGDDSP